MRTPSRVLLLSALSATALLASAAPSFADSAPQQFHTLKAPLSAVGGAPLKSGWVKDSHANSTIIGAHEEYHVTGASPDTAYQVVLQFYTGVTDCSGTAAPSATATFTTNKAGNGQADHVFAGGPQTPVSDNSAIWQIVGPDGAVDYTTSCQFIILGG